MTTWDVQRSRSRTARARYGNGRPAFYIGSWIERAACSVPQPIELLINHFGMKFQAVWTLRPQMFLLSLVIKHGARDGAGTMIVKAEAGAPLLS